MSLSYLSGQELISLVVPGFVYTKTCLCKDDIYVQGTTTIVTFLIFLTKNNKTQRISQFGHFC